MTTLLALSPAIQLPAANARYDRQLTPIPMKSRLIFGVYITYRLNFNKLDKCQKVQYVILSTMNILFIGLLMRTCASLREGIDNRVQYTTVSVLFIPKLLVTVRMIRSPAASCTWLSTFLPVRMSRVVPVEFSTFQS